MTLEALPGPQEEVIGQAEGFHLHSLALSRLLGGIDPPKEKATCVNM